MIRVDEQGYELDEQGTRLKDGEGNEVRRFVRDQKDIDTIVQARLKREKEASEKRIRELQATIESKGDPDGSLQARVEELEQSIATNEQKQAREAKDQERKLSQERERANTAEAKYRGMLLRNSLFAEASKNKFVNPENLSAVLNGAIVWEEAKDGGDPSFKFKLPVADEKDASKVEERYMTAAEAAAHIAKTQPHLIAGDTRGGSGTQRGSGLVNKDAALKDMNPMQKIAAGFGSGRGAQAPKV